MTHDPPARSGRVADPGHRRLGIRDAVRMDRDDFVAHFGGVFEETPWIAGAAWDFGPYESVAALHGAMVAAVDAAPLGVRRALIGAHPELAGKAAVAGALTAESAREQVAAGLDRLTPEQHARLLALTADYRARFGFPFVVCAREHTADSIIATAQQRLAHDPDEEERTALAEIAKIAELRLADLVTDEGTTA
ncbi:MAG TPA: 2-oxo-4-hydroxy-4-carboxy-5-ureidoimidazoline decarboxylase [Baekduia sp.]|uniref:2-oxo-4-hydroxy-4-carboxy-5-ureidoimidazoline decarboxylase n=1 Tax=Baekduia sp. TaxID=2600305 RepID=UPI002D17FB32|nr:2-oxo-4-hydroxy-4-carboxy-5-ureidoimidazoline decarboxylase [Baekduia sp.]HMJ32976.1 2-oxo-4-hydroxy-4-carboxy-5-ureidoimidazoline decarboxylase [Baekduia sp.]